jgi:hypothetical protein
MWVATRNVLSLNRTGSLEDLRRMGVTNWRIRAHRRMGVTNWRIRAHRRMGVTDWRTRAHRRMGVTDWRIHAHRIDNWKMVVKEAKVLPGLYSHGVVVLLRKMKDAFPEGRPKEVKVPVTSQLRFHFTTNDILMFVWACIPDTKV